MSVSTYFQLRNANDPVYLAAKNGTAEEQEKWIWENGPFTERPGAEIEGAADKAIQETEEEYGGWIIPISNLPKEVTHIVIWRG